MNLGINFDEPVDKIVGRRRKVPSGLSTATSNQAQSEEWRRALGCVGIPKGVYRLHTHAEADEWLWKMITRPKRT
jgi:hypothetical protein